MEDLYKVFDELKQLLKQEGIFWIESIFIFQEIVLDLNETFSEFSERYCSGGNFCDLRRQIVTFIKQNNAVLESEIKRLPALFRKKGCVG